VHVCSFLMIRYGRLGLFVIFCQHALTSFSSGPNKEGLKYPSVRPYVRTSVHKKFLRLQ